MDFLFIYVTYPSADVAAEISKGLIEARLVACANIFPAHQSLYWWEGAVQSASETAVIYKTRAGNFDVVKGKILSLHPYECPCVVALLVEKGHAGFLEWIEKETQMPE